VEEFGFSIHVCLGCFRVLPAVQFEQFSDGLRVFSALKIAQNLTRSKRRKQREVSPLPLFPPIRVLVSGVRKSLPCPLQPGLRVGEGVTLHEFLELRLGVAEE
jgi:hypothetical protein